MNETQISLKNQATEIRRELKLLSDRMDTICFIIGKNQMLYEIHENFKTRKTLELYKSEYIEITLVIKSLRDKLKLIVEQYNEFDIILKTDNPSKFR